MGAAVGADGTPSGAMKRRVDSALSIAKGPGFRFIVSGGTGRNKTKSEAEAMKQLLVSQGVSETDIITEDRSSTTLSSVQNCAGLLGKSGTMSGNVIVSTDTYHLPRCRWLFYLYGIPTGRSELKSGRKANGSMKWAFYYLREFAAIPVDSLLVFLDKVGLKRAAPAF